MSKVIVSGSIAYDYIMKMDDEFEKHILPDQLNKLSVWFLMPELEKHTWGTALNISYSLWLLGMKEQTIMLWWVGKDFTTEKKFENIINHQYILKDDKKMTACAYVLNDNKWNQITAFHPWAMMSAAQQSLKDLEANLNLDNNSENKNYLLVSPNAPIAMINHTKQWFEMGMDVFLDPWQALPSFNKEQLLEMAKHSKYLILNEYELNLFKQKTELSQDELTSIFDKIIVTLWSKWTKIIDKNIEELVVAAKIKNAIDPTWAWDSFRSGLITGLLKWETWENSIKLGNIVASFVVEKYGTTQHNFNINDIKERYIQTYNEKTFL